MPTTDEYKRRIQNLNRAGLIKLWKQILKKSTPAWEAGKAFEFLIIRAFELEGAIVRWPYPVKKYNEIIEQIDGAVHFHNSNLSVIVECKDYTGKINVEPIAKLRNQLLRRPVNAIGCVFTIDGFSESALTLSEYLAPQTILLWEKSNIEYCLIRASFKDGLLKKYRHAIEEGLPNFDITIESIYNE